MRPVAPALHLVKSALYAEARVLDAPPPGEVEWRVFTLVPRREVKVMHQLWYNARAIGASMLGLPPERVTCRRTDEVQIEEAQESELSGSGSA